MHKQTENSWKVSGPSSSKTCEPHARATSLCIDVSQDGFGDSAGASATASTASARLRAFRVSLGSAPAYIVKQVRDFRDCRRANDGGQMAANASDIGAADLAKAAAYFSAFLPPAPMSSDLHEPEFLRARALYWVGDASAGIASCASCHDGAEATPSLQSQHAGYLAKELDDLRSGARANDDGVMRAVASKLSDADIEALSDYLASQPLPMCAARSFNETPHPPSGLFPASRRAILHPRLCS